MRNTINPNPGLFGVLCGAGAHWLLLLLVASSLFLTGCNDDDDPVIEEEQEVDISIDQNSLDIALEEVVTVKITEGNGNYYAFSLNKEVAVVSASSDNLEITGAGIGKTSIIIMDGNVQLKTLPVIVYQYNEIRLDESNLEFDFPLGNVKNVMVTVLEGNGDYTAVSDSEEIQAFVSDDVITVSTVQGSGGGEANITITDACDRTAVVKVKANATNIPYSEEELEEIKAITSYPRFVFKTTTTTASYYTYYNTVEDGMNLSGYDYYGYYVLKIYYPGDKSVGEYQVGKIYYFNVPYGESSDGNLDLSHFEIIKNDGTAIWAIYALIDTDNVLQRGYFIQRINP